jgi:hypothetical protein
MKWHVQVCLEIKMIFLKEKSRHGWKSGTG